MSISRRKKYVKMKAFKYLMIFAMFCLVQSVEGQVKIELGEDEIAENHVFTVTIVAEGDRIKSYDDFPDIEGFVKRGTSSSSSTQIINGQVSSSHSITMSYSPRQQGIFILKPFKMKVNGDEIESKGKTIKVGPPAERKSRDPFRSLFDRDPFEDFFGERDEPEFVEVKEDAFLALTTNKSEVYVGEGVTADLSFYVSEENRAILQFYDLGRQLSEILKEIRPSNCWEENFNIENINGEDVVINGKRYTQYKIYEATFFPFNTETIEFPSVDLEMIKYRIAKNPSFFGTNRQEDYKNFSSRKKLVKVRELPPHPLQDLVAVGDYALNEKLSVDKVETGQSFKYDFTIYGEGNISSVERLIIPEDKNFDFYDPNISQKINRRNRKVSGSKTFSYYGIPSEPGKFFLGDYFSWVFFNPRTEKYDTLRSTYYVDVTGESKTNETIQASDLGSFYDRLEWEDNTLATFGNGNWMNIVMNVLIVLILGLSAYLIFKK